jgi:transposase
MERGIRLVFESGRPIAHVARVLGVSAEALRKRMRRAEADAGRRAGLVRSEERRGDPQAAVEELAAAPRE